MVSAKKHRHTTTVGTSCPGSLALPPCLRFNFDSATVPNLSILPVQGTATVHPRRHKAEDQFQHDGHENHAPNSWKGKRTVAIQVGGFLGAWVKFGAEEKRRICIQLYPEQGTQRLARHVPLPSRQLLQYLSSDTFLVECRVRMHVCTSLPGAPQEGPEHSSEDPMVQPACHTQTTAARRPGRKVSPGQLLPHKKAEIS